MNRLILLCLFACLCGRTASGQSLDSSISDYINRFPDEKIHVHFDKDNYLPGETVWMRGYLLSGSHPSGLSKNLYFDWTDADGRLLLHSVAPVNDGMASSYYRIPAWVKNGVLHVKVYTQWMLNFDQNFLFDRDIPILMPVSSLPPAPDKQQTRLDFFPEGGDLLNGVSSVLAFEASDQHGKPVEIRGVLKTASGTILDSFHTIYNGLGSVSIKPKKAERITAFWTDESGQTFSTAVPEPKVNGLVLHVDPYHQGQFHYRMERSADASNLTKITVMGTLHHKLVYKNSVFLTNNAGEGIIDASGLPSGVLQLTVLDGNMNPIAERVVFVNNGNNMSRIQLNKEVVNLEKRGRNEISFVLPDTLTAAFSVSVTDAGLGHDSSSNIFTDLLISGDIRGTLPDAASFLKNQATADENLNLLLLTHGWRRFNWEAVVSGKMPELKYPADQEFLSIRGEVRNSMDLDAQDSMALLLVSRDKKKQVIKLPVQANGQFAQNGLFFYDSVQVVYRFNHTSKIRNGQISVYSSLLPALTPAHADVPGFAWVRVPDVILEKEMNGNLIEGNDYSTASTAMSYTLSPNTGRLGKNSESIAHYLNENFVSLHFPATLKKADDSGDARFASQKSTNAARANVSITIDGSPVAMDDLKSVNMKEVLFIKFLPKSGKGLPTLAITSRQAIEQNNIMENKTGFAIVTGYTPMREFYSPRYVDKITDSKASDFRSTLYWNDGLRADKEHRKISFTFYNNDISTKFRIVIEGMDKEGRLYRGVEIIK